MSADELLRFGRFEISPVERMLRVDGRPAALGARAFDLLLTLARHRERVVTKQELLELVWPGVVVEEHNITAQISTLRKLLGADAIATVPGRGYQLTAVLDDAPAPVPPGHNLPDQRTCFIGREEALADLARLLPTSRLLSLIGIGGCGKTRLAVEFARAQPEAWFVDLAPLTDPDHVTSACAAALGIREGGDTPLRELVIQHLRARSAMVVFDNCEHVLRGAAELIEAVLSGAPATAIVATSREALGVRGEQMYPVPSLSLPATNDLDVVRRAESVRVFADRARLAVPEFEIDAGNAASVAEICRRLDGIALAIELAAARITMLSPAQIAERLDERFRLLATGHKTLVAALSWSYEQLAPPAQRMLRRVSVFAGGWTLDAAASVAESADDLEALALLSALYEKSLLVVDRTASERPRYRLLETVRQYAKERLIEHGESDDARVLHLAHYVGLAETAASHWHGPAQAAWLERLRQEHENLVAALTWSADRGDEQAGLRLAAATTYYWIWNSVELGQRLALAVLARDRSATDTRARAETLDGVARASLSRGRYDEAVSYARQAVDVARKIGGPRPLAQALQILGAASAAGGNLDDARQYHEEALLLAREMDDAMLISNLLNGIAETRRLTGALDAAEQAYREALALSRHGGGMTMIVILDNLIRVQVARGELDDARRLARECLPLVRGEKVRVDLLEAAVGIAAASGAHERAARFWGTADHTLLAWGYRHQPVDLAHVTPLLASCRSALGEAAYAAAEAAGRALDLDAAMAELEDWLGA